MLIRYPLGFQISQNSDENKIPPKKPVRVARRENFGDFKGVFKANRGGTLLETRRAKRAAKKLVFSSGKKGVPPCFQGGFEGRGTPCEC